jgi:hypothetical protein
MMKKLLVILILAFSVNAEECKSNLSVSKVESIASPYVGTIHSVKLSKSRKGECILKFMEIKDTQLLTQTMENF